ncbi:hypothetical protein HPB52_004672 [Rhipicephalus sanguineus]|uniref:Tick transposon n=1 Tax=Rhipicephalus sanguineus TaxID=34632 RepID=A0A9D4QCA5_RHISA|nr:hypothetical protein HPB52_004672 [Rhipicephalus sanguineus]
MHFVQGRRHLATYACSSERWGTSTASTVPRTVQPFCNACAACQDPGWEASSHCTTRWYRIHQPLLPLRRHTTGPLSRCGDPETLEHLLCACPGLAQERSRFTTAYRSQGLPASTLEHLLFPSRPHLPALRSLVEFLDETGIAAYR